MERKIEVSYNGVLLENDKRKLTHFVQHKPHKLKREHSAQKEIDGKDRPAKSPRRVQVHTTPQSSSQAQSQAAISPNIGAAAISMVSDMLNLVKVRLFDFFSSLEAILSIQSNAKILVHCLL